MFEDERNSTAALIAADPAFTSLEASGAPILAVMGTPPRVVYANAAAAAVFGADPAARLLTGGERGLAAAIDRLRGSGAPRLERLSIDLGAGVQTITILCRRLFESDDAPCFAVAALGLRADDAAPREPAPEASRAARPKIRGGGDARRSGARRTARAARRAAWGSRPAIPLEDRRGRPFRRRDACAGRCRRREIRRSARARRGGDGRGDGAGPRLRGRSRDAQVLERRRGRLAGRGPRLPRPDDARRAADLRRRTRFRGFSGLWRVAPVAGDADRHARRRAGNHAAGDGRNGSRAANAAALGSPNFRTPMSCRCGPRRRPSPRAR